MNIQATNSAAASMKLIMEQTDEMAKLYKDMRTASIDMSEKLLKVSVADSVDAGATNNLVDFLA